MARMDAMTIKMDAQYKKLKSQAKQPTPDLDDDDMHMSCEEEAKFMQTFWMPNYGKFLKELISNKHKIEQISAAFWSDEIDLGGSINLMPYSLSAKLSLETLKPTKMSVRLADRSFQYPVGITENMLVKVGKFSFPADFVILEMKEDSKVLLILGRPFLHTDDEVIELNRNNSILDIDVIDEILKEDFDALLDEGSKILHSIEGTLLKEEIFSEFDEFMAMAADENSKSESDIKEPPINKITINTDYKIKTSLEEPLRMFVTPPNWVAAE
nr:hypothetical protein [Tanacetum cinerariifolium]